MSIVKSCYAGLYIVTKTCNAAIVVAKQINNIGIFLGATLTILREKHALGVTFHLTSQKQIL